MKNTNPLLLVLLVLVVLGGGALAGWLTMPESDEFDVPARTTETAARNATDFQLQPPVADAPVPQEQKNVQNYLEKRFGERGRNVLNAPSQDYTDGRPVYHSAKVYQTVDRNGDPIFTKMIWSPLPPRRIEPLPQKVTPTASASGTGEVAPHVSIRLDDPNLQKVLAESKAMLGKSTLNPRWIGDQGQNAAGSQDAKVKKVVPDIEEIFEKLGDSKSQGGNGQKGAAGKGKKGK
ncbi:MAG: hypothetical protein R3F34_02960 [Planctomycetota bacterium]